LNELADGGSEYLSRFDFNVKSLASGSATTLKVKDDFWGSTVTWWGQIYNEGGGYTTISTEENQTFEDGTTSKILPPYGAALIFGRSPGVWNLWPIPNTRGNVTLTGITTPSTGSKKTTFSTFDAVSGFEFCMHNGTGVSFSNLGSWGSAQVHTVEFEGLPGQGSVGQFMTALTLDGYINWHPQNARPPEAGFTRIWMSDGITGYSQGKLAMETGSTAGGLTVKILSDMDLSAMTSGNATSGNLPEFTGAGAEVTDSGIHTDRLDQFKAGIVGENITADVTDFTVAGLSTTQSVLMVPDADGWTVKGIATGGINRKLTIFNPSAYYFKIAHVSEECLAANRINSYTNSDYIVLPGTSLTLLYDNDGGVWRIVSEIGLKTRSGSGTPVGTALPRWECDEYYDTSGKRFWKAIGLTVNDWVEMLQAPTD
jgi:hypothetical protein